MNQGQAIKSKITSYFQGNLTLDEEIDLLNWIKKDSKNKAYFLELKSELSADPAHHGLISDSFSELRNKIFINEQFKFPRSGKTRQLYLKFSKIAALLLLVVSLGFSLGWLTTKYQHQKEVWFEANSPRGEKTKLTLPDGSHVWLNSESTLSFPQ